jgi:hypothetical protein
VRARHKADLWFLFLLLHEFLDDALDLALLVFLELVDGTLVFEEVRVIGFFLLAGFVELLWLHCCFCYLIHYYYLNHNPGS